MSYVQPRGEKMTTATAYNFKFSKSHNVKAGFQYEGILDMAVAHQVMMF